MENVMYAMGMLKASYVKSRCRFFFGVWEKGHCLATINQEKKDNKNDMLRLTQLPAGRQLDGGMALRANALRVGVAG